MGRHDCTCNSALPETTGLYGLHGVHLQMHNGLGALAANLWRVHRWPRGKAAKWVQLFLDPMRIPARTATGVPLEDEGGDKKRGLRLEQIAAAEWVKSEGWDCIADHLEQDGLLLHIVDMGPAQVSWTDSFRQWGKSPFATSNLAWK